jgi:ubiquitin-like-conjugating enzyme ATG3
MVKSAGLRVAEHLSTVPTVSTFKDTGKLTPDEFVAAGDHLVYHCRTWTWVSVEDPSKRKAYLPPDKQYLQTKSVPCYRRANQIQDVRTNEQLLKLTDDDDGWIDTHHDMNVEEVTEELEELKVKKVDPPTVTTPTVGTQLVDDSDSDDDGPIADFEDFKKDTIEEDDPATLPPKEVTTTKSTGVIKARSYDLNITYDNFYNTPRLWLFGYDENGKSLTPEMMYADISTDHLHKTVTLEPHPHLPPPEKLSVHPCRHAEVMKKIMAVVEEDGRELEVHTYLMVFLKFVQAVIPTIEYDYTKQLSLAS